MVYKRQLKTMLFFNGLLQLLKDFFCKMAVYKLMLNQFTPELNIANFFVANNELIFSKHKVGNSRQLATMLFLNHQF